MFCYTVRTKLIVLSNRCVKHSSKMNSFPKVSNIPIQKILSSTSSRSLGVHVGYSNKGSYNNEYEKIVQINSPAEVKNMYGFDKCFVETRGDRVMGIAATKKLLSEEKLRQGLMSLNRVPLNKYS